MSALLASVIGADPLVCLVSLYQDRVPALNGVLGDSAPNVTARIAMARSSDGSERDGSDRGDSDLLGSDRGDSERDGRS